MRKWKSGWEDIVLIDLIEDESEESDDESD
jgi:hypothetical protein